MTKFIFVLSAILTIPVISYGSSQGFSQDSVQKPQSACLQMKMEVNISAISDCEEAAKDNIRRSTKYLSAYISEYNRDLNFTQICEKHPSFTLKPQLLPVPIRELTKESVQESVLKCLDLKKTPDSTAGLDCLEGLDRGLSLAMNQIRPKIQRITQRFQTCEKITMDVLDPQVVKDIVSHCPSSTIIYDVKDRYTNGKKVRNFEKSLKNKGSKVYAPEELIGNINAIALLTSGGIRRMIEKSTEFSFIEMHCLDQIEALELRESLRYFNEI